MEHEKTLHAVLTHFKEFNFTLRKQKCQTYMPPIEFFGVVFSEDCRSPDPVTVEAITQAEAPTTVSDVCSLLGMANYVAHVMHGYADITAPLCDLTHKVLNLNGKMITEQHWSDSSVVSHWMK